MYYHGQLQSGGESILSQGVWFQPCVEVIPTISSRNLSTSRTISGSFPASEVTFHVPRAIFRVQGSGCLGPRLRLPPDPLSTGPLRSLLQVVSPQEGGPTSLLRAEPGRTPWVEARPPGARIRAPTPGPGSRVGPRLRHAGRRHGPCFSVHHKGFLNRS